MIADTEDAAWYIEAGFVLLEENDLDAQPSWFRLAVEEQMPATVAVYQQPSSLPDVLWVDRRGQHGWTHVRYTLSAAVAWMHNYHQRDQTPVDVFHTTLRLVHCETGEIIPGALWNL